MDLETFLPNLNLWLENYIKGFASRDPNVQGALDLKQAHTGRVCKAILDIGRHEGLSADDLYMAEMAALLHDIGRFEQYRKYKTFSDARSENHALLGLKIISESNVLQRIDPARARTIMRAIEYHNKAALPAGENGRDLFFMKLLRDADKVDIWHVVTDYYANAHKDRNPTIELNLPDTPDLSDAVCRSLMNGNIVQMRDLKTLNDFKLLQIGWIYDINFRRTFQMVQERKYLERILAALPEGSTRIEKVYERAREYLYQKAFKENEKF